MVSPAKVNDGIEARNGLGCQGLCRVPCNLSFSWLACPLTSCTTDQPLDLREASNAAPIRPGLPLTRILEFTMARHFQLYQFPKRRNNKPAKMRPPRGARAIILHGELRQQIATTALTLTKFRELMKRIQENRPQDDLSIVKKAYDYSLKNHEGQSRASGEPYLVHPLEVALVLAEMKMDPVAIAAGLLHDSVEDTSVTIVDIRKEFGEQVAHIVEGVTKISKIDFATREERRPKTCAR